MSTICGRKAGTCVFLRAGISLLRVCFEAVRFVQLLWLVSDIHGNEYVEDPVGSYVFQASEAIGHVYEIMKKVAAFQCWTSNSIGVVEVLLKAPYRG